MNLETYLFSRGQVGSQEGGETFGLDAVLGLNQLADFRNKSHNILYLHPTVERRVQALGHLVIVDCQMKVFKELVDGGPIEEQVGVASLKTALSLFVLCCCSGGRWFLLGEGLRFVVGLEGHTEQAIVLRGAEELEEVSVAQHIPGRRDGRERQQE